MSSLGRFGNQQPVALPHPTWSDAPLRPFPAWALEEAHELAVHLGSGSFVPTFLFVTNPFLPPSQSPDLSYILTALVSSSSQSKTH